VSTHRRARSQQPTSRGSRGRLREDGGNPSCYLLQAPVRVGDNCGASWFVGGVGDDEVVSEPGSLCCQRVEADP
jgi:hypothetical protein